MKLFKYIYRWCITPHHLFVITIAVLALPNVVLCVTEHTSFVAKTCNILLPVGGYWMLMSLCRRPGLSVWMLFPVVFLAAFQLVLTYLFGRSVIAVDMFLNLITTNPGEALELLDKIAPSVVIVVVIYVPVLVSAACSLRYAACLDAGFLKRQRKYSSILLASGVLAVGVAYAADEDYRVENDIYPVNVCYNLVMAVERTRLTTCHDKMSEHFSFKASSVNPKDSAEVYVLVVGETARAMNFGLFGYRRNTTPLLADMEGLVAFRHVLTQSNTTHKSVPMLLSAASAVDYARIYGEKSILTAFREAGFHTVFLSNQKPNRSFIDFFGAEADECVFLKELLTDDENVFDDQLLGYADKVLREGHKKVFLVLHCYGSHFNYRERYRRSDAKFLPDDNMEAKASNRTDLVNAYDNTILATDKMLHSLFCRLEQSGAAAAVVYTSDHGENIFDDNRELFLHASPVPSYYDMHVPFLVWTSSAYRSVHRNRVAALLENKDKDVENSASTFHTMIDLAGISTPVFVDTLSVASANYRVGCRHYLDDHNKAVTLDKLKLDAADYSMMRRVGIGGIKR